eukprot:scaffold107305_cov63-Phaeocystis_antarctica.AAC.4
MLSTHTHPCEQNGCPDQLMQHSFPSIAHKGSYFGFPLTSSGCASCGASCGALSLTTLGLGSVGSPIEIEPRWVASISISLATARSAFRLLGGAACKRSACIFRTTAFSSAFSCVRMTCASLSPIGCSAAGARVLPLGAPGTAASATRDQLKLSSMLALAELATMRQKIASFFGPCDEKKKKKKRGGSEITDACRNKISCCCRRCCFRRLEIGEDSG